MSVTPRRLTAAAALAYVIAAGVENMELLGAPGYGAVAEAIRAGYADGALATATWVAGALSLLAYGGFAVGLHRLTAAADRGAAAHDRPPCRRRAARRPPPGSRSPARRSPRCSPPRAWSPAGCSWWTAGRTARTPRCAGCTSSSSRCGCSPGPRWRCSSLAGGRAAARAGVLRSWQWPLAGATACLVALAPLAAISQDAPAVAAAFVAFGLHSLWIWLAGLQLAVGLDVRRAAFLMLVLAAGLVGVALLIAPGATGAFFAWELAPAGLAAFAGGVYVGSAVVYGIALAAGDRAVRGLIAGAVALSVSVLAITLAHRAVFDFGRLQAWAWLVLFAGFGLTTTALLVRAVRARRARATALAPSARGLLALAGLALAGAGLALWLDPAGAGLPPLGGRFAGSWSAMLAVAALWAAARDDAEEARLPALALVDRARRGAAGGGAHGHGRRGLRDRPARCS